MSNRFPQITPKQAEDIAKANGWEDTKAPRTSGDHNYYRRPDFELPLQIDMGETAFYEKYIKMMMKRMNLTREQFYGSTKKMAKKAGVKYICPKKQDDNE